jgi:hypothetical protein
MANEMKRTITVLCLCALAVIGCRFGQVQWVHAQYPGGVEFIGVRKSERAPTTYFSVRVKGANGRPIPADCFLTVHWQGSALSAGNTVSSELVAAGIQVEPQEYMGPDATSGFVGGATEQNQDYGIEFHLVSGQLVELYARHSDQNGVTCPFELSGPNGSRIRFPFGETELKKHFGEPESITGVWGY